MRPLRLLARPLASTIRASLVPVTRPVVSYKPRHSVRSLSSALPRQHEADRTDTLHKVCWRCNHLASKAAVQCQNKDCGVIQAAAPDVNFYELLGVGTGESRNQPTFDIDNKQLKKSFLKLQQAAHPDGFSQASQQEHKYARNQSSVINKAFNTLKGPLSRAQYMLALRGVEVGEAESLHDPELLMQVMEIREALEEACSEEEVAQIKVQNDENMQETIQELSQAFTKADIEQAKDYVVQLQYWENIRQAIVDWAPGKRVEIRH